MSNYRRKRFWAFFSAVMTGFAILGVLSIVSLLIVGIIGAIVHEGFLSAALSGWLQALGGILAVFAAFGVVQYQIRVQKESEESRLKGDAAKRERVIFKVVELIRQECLAINGGLPQTLGNWSEMHTLTMLKRLHVALNTIPVLEIPHVEMAYSLFSLQAGVEELVVVLERNAQGDGVVSLTEADRMIDKLGEVTMMAGDVLAYDIDMNNSMSDFAGASR